MQDLTLFNKTVETVKDKLYFSPYEKDTHGELLEAYEVLQGYDFKRAYNLNKRLKNGLRFKSVSHLLDTVRNIPEFL